MNITKENAGALELHLKLDVVQSDYQEAVTKILKDYQRKANLPGFRPGKVPFGMVEKMYGKAVFAEQLDKVLSEALTNYLKDNNIDTIGSPLPIDEKNNIDFDKEKDFSFWFQIGLRPEINLDAIAKLKVPYNEIIAEEETIEKTVDNARKRFGKLLNPEEENPELHNYEPAEMNEDFFKKVYPKKDIKTETEFKQTVKEETEAYYNDESDRRMFNESIEKIVEAVQFDMPDNFLQHWILANHKNATMTLADVQKDYDQFKKSMKWQLIEEELLKQNNVKVGYEDVRQFYKEKVLAPYFPSATDEESENRLNAFADQMLQNKEEAQRIYEVVMERKLIDIVKSLVKLDKKQVMFKDFVEQLRKDAEKNAPTQKETDEIAVTEETEEVKPKKVKKTKTESEIPAEETTSAEKKTKKKKSE